MKCPFCVVVAFSIAGIADCQAELDGANYASVVLLQVLLPGSRCSILLLITGLGAALARGHRGGHSCISNREGIELARKF